jgi:hypothetical protein
MNRHATAAVTHPCLLSMEVIHPRFGWKDPAAGLSLVLTVNAGYE